MPLPFTYYFRDKIDARCTPKWLKVYFWGLVVAEIVYIASAVILQETSLVHLPQILVGSHILMILAIVLILAISVIDIKVRKQRPTIVMIGFLIAIAIVIVELIRFNMEKYITGFARNEYSSDTCFAVLIIVISMLVDYGSKTSKLLFENAQKAVLEQMEEKNKSESEVILSTAYGYAMKGEIPLKQEQNEKINLKVVDIGPRAVYRIADDRMYENKRKSKLGRQ